MTFSKEQIAFLFSQATADSLEKAARSNPNQKQTTRSVIDGSGVIVSAKFSEVPSKGHKISFKIKKES